MNKGAAFVNRSLSYRYTFKSVYCSAEVIYYLRQTEVAFHIFVDYAEASCDLFSVVLRTIVITDSNRKIVEHTGIIICTLPTLNYTTTY